MPKFRITYDRKSFIFNGKRKFINSGELHYFRIPRSQWKDRLLKCKRAFLNTLGAYIAWNWHEEKEGKFNFEGDRDLSKWISLAEEVGLFIFIRPGPYICSEWDMGGFPNWLIPKDCELRSLEPNFMKYCIRYLDKVNEIIKPHLITKGGKIFLYQVENEFEVGDIPYHLKLKEIVEKDGIDVPICTNENAWVRGTDIIEGPDPYLRSWLISDAMIKIRDLIKTQPDKPPFAPEVGTCMIGWFYGHLPFSDGYRPPELDEVNLKGLIAAGISGFNWYMYHGGTNIGYWTARNIATTYDFDAPIKEWGELGKRYYISRRIGGFLESFEKKLLETTPVEGECSVDEKGVEVFLRKNKNTAFLFLANTYFQARSFKITIKNPQSARRIIFPRKGKYQLPGHSMSILPVNLKISHGLTILYSTSEIFYFIDNGKEKVLILYREHGLDGELALKMKGKKDIKIINYVHEKEPKFITIEGKERLRLIIIDKDTASTTWFFNYQGKKYPIISNIYFLEGERKEGKNIHLTFQVKEGATWLKMFLQPAEIRVDNKKIDFRYDKKKEIAGLNLPDEEFPKIHYNLSGRWKIKEENLEIGDNNTWLDWQTWKGLEEYGFLRNGHAWFKTNFRVSKVISPLYLILTAFQDEVSVYLNGRYVKSGRDNLRCDVSSFVKEGDNLLMILVESEGHHNAGEKSFNGLNSPVYLSGEEKSLELKEWKRKLIPDTYPEKSIFEERHAEIKPEFNDSDWEKVRVDKKWDSRMLKSIHEKCFVWYRTETEISDDFKAKNLSLDFEKYMRDKIYLFVNGKFSGFRDNTLLYLPFSFDLSDKIKPGKNTIVIGIKSDRWIHYFGLHDTVKISLHEHCLNKEWKIKEGIPGQNNGYFKVDFDDSNWEEIETSKRKGPPGSLVWFRKKVKIEPYPSYVAPLRLTLKNTTSKALIYFNGVLIGRYADTGAQEDFYIWEDIIKEENTVAILVDGRDKGASLGEVSISPYYMAKKIDVEVKIK